MPLMPISRKLWMKAVQEGSKLKMNQYIVYYQDGGTEYVDAYSYTKHGTTYVFDLGHGNFKNCNEVKMVEIIND